MTNGNNSGSSKKRRKRYANVQNPTIQAILGGHFRFQTPQQAQKRLDYLRENFIIARLPEDVEPDPLQVKLWIKGYGLSEQLQREGYLGNYAKIEVVRAKQRDRWTIKAVMLVIDKKYHPQRCQPVRRHPNWGHPIMRDIKRGRVHKRVKSAQHELKRLHDTFPEVSIPLTNKMYIMVYQKTTDGKPPIKKWVLEIKATEDGRGFFIDYYENTYVAPKRPETSKDENVGEAVLSGAEDAVPIGKFTAAALLKKSRKTAPLIKKKDKEE